ncbi:unnamed protein product, partial [Meganyctiphanes norvegica]
MNITVKLLQGNECTVEVTGSTKISELKPIIHSLLYVEPNSQRLVYRGKTLTDGMTLEDAGIPEGGKIHLMVKKSVNNPTSVDSKEACNGASNSVPHVDFFAELETNLRKHLTADQTE